MRSLAHAPVDLVLVHLAQLQPEGEVVVDGHVRVERVVLEDHRDVAVLRLHVVHDLVADAQRALADVLEPRHHPQGGRLAAAGRADEDHELAVLDGEVEVGHCAGAVRVDLGDVLERDLSHGEAP